MMEQELAVDYALIDKAIQYYKVKGYNYIYTPWLIEKEYYGITSAAKKRQDLQVSYPDKDDNYLVASAEQGFLQLMYQGKLQQDLLYVSCTPCFRPEPIVDNLHKLYFMKVELFSWGSNRKTTWDYRFLLQDAHNFFADNITTSNSLTTEVVSDNQMDLLLNGIEIGSYNRNSLGAYNWVCGTGLAEPRFSASKFNNK